MKFDLIIIRYAEIALKAKQTRRRFESTLVNNIKDALKTKNIPNSLRKEWGRIYVYSNQIEKCVEVLQKIFGISSISPAIQTESIIKEISKIAISISKQKLDRKKSFAVRATRTGDHDFSSQDVAVQIGNDIVKETNASVNLKSPDFELFIEIRNDFSYLSIKKIKCYGGMPVGTQGNILAFIDSPNAILASWYLIHRGCKPIFLSTNEIEKTSLNNFVNNWFLKSKIFEIFPNENFNKQINKIAFDYNCDAVVTGFTLFDDSKISLEKIKQQKKLLDLPILHPLIAMEKQDINKKIKELGLVK